MVGYLALAIAIPAVFMVIGLFVAEVSVRQGIAVLSAKFLSQIVILALAVPLGEVVRSRRALTAETARRLRLAREERTAEAGRAVAEERLRIARELHDTGGARDGDDRGAGRLRAACPRRRRAGGQTLHPERSGLKLPGHQLRTTA